MVSYPRAEIATVKIGHLEFEGLMLSDGTYGIGVPQVCSVFQTDKNQASRTIKSILGEAFQFDKWRSTLHPKAVNVLSLIDFEKLLRKLDRSGNLLAQTLVDSLIGLSLQQLFSDAFCVKFEQEERQKWLQDRGEGKIYRRTLTDSIKDYLLAHPKEDSRLYPIVTDLIYLGIFNRRAAQLKTDWDEKNPRDSMTSHELFLVAEVEALASRLIDYDHLHPMSAAKQALRVLRIPVCDR
jgi:hypothetical protein